MYKKFFSQIIFFEIVDFSTANIISSHVITELSLILAKYLPFLQLIVAGFQI